MGLCNFRKMEIVKNQHLCYWAHAAWHDMPILFWEKRMSRREKCPCRFSLVHFKQWCSLIPVYCKRIDFSCVWLILYSFNSPNRQLMKNTKNSMGSQRKNNLDRTLKSHLYTTWQSNSDAAVSYLNSWKTPTLTISKNFWISPCLQKMVGKGKLVMTRAPKSTLP